MTRVTAGMTEERDRLTRARLADTGEAPSPPNVRGFRHEWWDGAAYVPSLVVNLDGARCRLVQNRDQVVALPANSWRARRAMRRLRRPATADPRLLALAQKRPDPRRGDGPRVAVVPQRSGDHPRGQPTAPLPRRDLPRVVVHIEQAADVVRCGSAGCAALVPIPPPGRLLADTTCPQCGRVELPAQQMSPGTAPAVVSV